jgi:hypothetical protein
VSHHTFTDAQTSGISTSRPAPKKKKKVNEPEAVSMHKLTKTMQSVLPRGFEVDMDAKEMIQKLALYFTYFVLNEALDTPNHSRTITGEMVLRALDVLGFHEYATLCSAYMDMYGDAVLHRLNEITGHNKTTLPRKQAAEFRKTTLKRKREEREKRERELQVRREEAARLKMEAYYQRQKEIEEARRGAEAERQALRQAREAQRQAEAKRKAEAKRQAAMAKAAAKAEAKAAKAAAAANGNHRVQAVQQQHQQHYQNSNYYAGATSAHVVASGNSAYYYQQQQQYLQQQQQQKK